MPPAKTVKSKGLMWPSVRGSFIFKLHIKQRRQEFTTLANLCLWNFLMKWVVGLFLDEATMLERFWWFFSVDISSLIRVYFIVNKNKNPHWLPVMHRMTSWFLLNKFSTSSKKISSGDLVCLCFHTCTDSWKSLCLSHSCNVLVEVCALQVDAWQ